MARVCLNIGDVSHQETKKARYKIDGNQIEVHLASMATRSRGSSWFRGWKKIEEVYKHIDEVLQ